MEVFHWKTLVWSCISQSCCFREVKMDHYKSYNSNWSCSQESGQWLFLGPFPAFLYPRIMLYIRSFRWDVIEIPMYPSLQHSQHQYPDLVFSMTLIGLPWWLSDKESAYNAGVTEDADWIPGLQRSLEEGMATHSSILDWRIPWIEEPGRLQLT